MRAISTTLFLLLYLAGANGLAAEATPRLVITGFDAEGQSIIVSDEAPSLMLRQGPNSYMGDLWRAESLPANNQGGFAPKSYALEPSAAGGLSFRIISIPPQQETPDSADNEFGMHQTDTIDFITIIAGEIFAVMDSGQEVLLRAGDTFIQRGTNHAWVNRGDVPALFSAVMIKPANPMSMRTDSASARQH